MPEAPSVGAASGSPAATGEATDTLLLQDFVGRADHAAFGAIMRRYGPMVLGVCRRVLRNSADADDAFQATFLVLAQKAGSIRNLSSLPDWLFGVALRTAKKSRASDTLRRTHMERHMAQHPNEPAHDPPRANDLEAVVDEQVERLPEKLRKVVVLCYLNGLTKREAAAKLLWPEGTVATRLAQARELLRERLTAHGVAAPADRLGATLVRQAVVPAALSASTLQAATSFATGSAAGAASAHAIALAKGVLNGMNLARAKVVAAGLFIVFVTIVGTAIAIQRHGTAASPPLASNGPAPSTQPTTTPAPIMAATLPAAPTTYPSGAELVRAVRDSESWIERVNSFSEKFESTWTRTPESIEMRKGELKRQFPNLQITERRFPELRPLVKENTLIAFDQKRIVNHADREGDSLQVQIFDGTRAMFHEYYVANKQENYGFDKTTDWFSQFFFFSSTSWPPAGHHRLWWYTAKSQEIPDPKPEEFEILGRENYRGINCWVLNLTGYNFHRWYVGVEDHLLHGNESGALRGNPATAQLLKAVGAEHGQNFTTFGELFRWTRTLPREQGESIIRDYLTRQHRTDHPMFDNWTLDYKEVAPGCWFPMTQGYIIYQGDFAKPIEQTHRDIHFTDVRADKELPAEWFTMELKEGVQVVDRTADPPLIYKYKKDMTADEWAQILQEAAERQQGEEQRKALADVAVGRAAPPFPPGQWLNSPALSWADLKGKFVILDFWAEWCGPCRNDLPTMVQLHKDSKSSGIVVIGIHTAGSSLDKIQRMMKDYQMSYPVFIDLPANRGGPGFGLLYNQYGVTAIPHSFLIDDTGKVVSHGTPAKCWPKRGS